MEIKVSNVPCGSCYVCCQWDAIILHPECGDDESGYHTVEYMGKRKLASKENGDCIYLDRKIGCTIHGHAPVICREFDCRMIAKKAKKDPQLRMYVGKDIIKAAKRLNRRVKGLSIK